MQVTTSLSIKTAVLCSFFLTFTLSAAPQSTSQHTANNYSDCADLTFQNVDNSDKTKEEELAALDEDLFSVLNQSEECMSEAVVKSSGRIGEAGTGGGNADIASESTSEGEQTTDPNMQESDPTQQRQQTASSSGERGDGTQGGSTEVCETVNQALKNASTESEKSHFESLLEQYNCN